MSEQAHHYYGCTGFNWATAPTREEVITKLARDLGASVIRQSKKNNGGVYCWTCKVNAPQNTPYAIEYYQPKGVEWVESKECLIISVKGTNIPKPSK
jgi:hypothetical protein